MMAKQSRILLKGTDKRLDHNQGHKDQNYLQEVSSMSAQAVQATRADDTLPANKGWTQQAWEHLKYHQRGKCITHQDGEK